MSDLQHPAVRAAVTHVISWDSCAIAQAHAAHLQEEDSALSDEEAFQQACADPFLYDDAWDDLLQDLDALLGQIAPDRAFHAEGRNLGWRRVSGHTTFHARCARDFLRHLLPGTDCTFTIARIGGTLHITNYHHDAPTGEFYTITAAEPEDGT